ncbi:hypothetical protein PF004_g1859 [Phytophthora fragariae]|nr:hypothetical protein PF004_g1859 [Phytophthora fragariae]
MSRKIVELQPQLGTRPRTMMDKVAEWLLGKFNKRQAEEPRGSLLDVLLRDIMSVDLLSASVKTIRVTRNLFAFGFILMLPLFNYTPYTKIAVLMGAEQLILPLVVMLQVTKLKGGELLILLLPTVLRAPGCRPPAPGRRPPTPPGLRPPPPGR